MPYFKVIVRSLDDEDNEEIFYENHYSSWFSAEDKFDLMTKIYASSASLLEAECYCVHPIGDFGCETNPPSLNWWNAAMNDYQFGQREETISMYDPERKWYVRMSRQDIEYVRALYGAFEILT